LKKLIRNPKMMGQIKNRVYATRKGSKKMRPVGSNRRRAAGLVPDTCVLGRATSCGASISNLLL
jgi:hypothetical protein